MSDDGKVTKYLVIFTMVFMFSLLLADWDSSAPIMYRFGDFQDALDSDPFAGVPGMPSFPQGPCDYGSERNANGTCVPVYYENCDSISNPIEKVKCQLRNFGDQVARAIGWVFMWIGSILMFVGLVIYTVIYMIVSGIVWFLGIIIAFFGALLNMASAGFGTMFPEPISTFMLIVFLPFIFIVFLLIIRIIRGN